MNTIRYFIIFLVIFALGCGDENPQPPPQPSAAVTVAEIEWWHNNQRNTLPPYFNISEPPVTTHGNPKKVGYIVTGQLVDKKGQPVRVAGVRIGLMGVIPNAIPSGEVAGWQNIFVFQPGDGRPVKTPGVGVFEGMKIECVDFVQTTTTTDENGQFTITFFVQADTFYEGNQIKMKAVALLVKNDGTILKRCALWKAQVPSPLSRITGQSVLDLARHSSLTDLGTGQSPKYAPFADDPDFERCNLNFLQNRVMVPCAYTPMFKSGVCGCGQTEDSDEDGVRDCRDECPEDPFLWELNEFCSCGTAEIPNSDADGDYVPDCLDKCPLNPLFSEIPPCPEMCDSLDSDWDGILDCADVCPGVNDILDSDADGVPDCLDGCPLDPLRINCLDRDIDGDVDIDDLVYFEQCATGPGISITSGCEWADLDNDNDIDQLDFAEFQLKL